MFHLTIEGLNAATYKTFSYDLVYEGTDIEFAEVILQRINYLASQLNHRGFKFEPISNNTANWSHEKYGSIVIIFDTI